MPVEGNDTDRGAPSTNGTERYAEVERNRWFRVGMMRKGDGIETIEVIVHLVPQDMVDMNDLGRQVCRLEALRMMGFSLWGEGGDVVAERPVNAARSDVTRVLDELRVKTGQTD